MYSILFVVLFLVLTIDSQTNEPTLVALSTTTPSLSRLSSSIPSTQRTSYSPTSPWPIPSRDGLIWSTDLPGFEERCIPAKSHLDIIFVVDSSTSSYYGVELLYLISDIIENVLPFDSRIGLVSFSGCPRKFGLKKCKQQGLLRKIIGLENDLDVVLNAVSSLQSGIHCKISS